MTDVAAHVVNIYTGGLLSSIGPDFELEVSKEENDIGSWSLRIPANSRAEISLRSWTAGIIVMVNQVHFFSGIVTGVSRFEDEKDSNGYVTFTGTSLNGLLEDRLAFPDPENPAHLQRRQRLSAVATAGGSLTRGSLMQGLVDLNMGAGAGVPERQILGLQSNPGPDNTLNTVVEFPDMAWQPLLGLLQWTAGTTHLFELRALGGLKFWTSTRRNKTNYRPLSPRLGSVSSFDADSLPPEARSAVALTGGDLGSRRGLQVWSGAVQPDRWSYRSVERVVDVPDGATITQMSDIANDALSRLALSSTSVQVELSDSDSFPYGSGIGFWEVGDIFRVVVGSEYVTVPITGARLSLSPGNLQMGITLGPPTARDYVGEIQRQARRVRNIDQNLASRPRFFSLADSDAARVMNL